MFLKAPTYTWLKSWLINVMVWYDMKKAYNHSTYFYMCHNSSYSWGWDWDWQKKSFVGFRSCVLHIVPTFISWWIRPINVKAMGGSYTRGACNNPRSYCTLSPYCTLLGVAMGSLCNVTYFQNPRWRCRGRETRRLHVNKCSFCLF